MGQLQQLAKYRLLLSLVHSSISPILCNKTSREAKMPLNDSLMGAPWRDTHCVLFFYCLTSTLHSPRLQATDIQQFSPPRCFPALFCRCRETHWYYSLAESWSRSSWTCITQYRPLNPTSTGRSCGVNFLQTPYRSELGCAWKVAFFQVDLDQEGSFEKAVDSATYM